jgi:hypothetical protein
LFLIPIALLLIDSDSRAKNSQWKLFFACLAGAVAAVVATCLICGVLDLRGGYAAPFVSAGTAMTAKWQWHSQLNLRGLPGEIPLLLAVAFAAMMAAWQHLKTRSRKYPELLLVVAAVAIVAIHPSRLGVMVFIAFGFIAAFRYAAQLWIEVRQISSWAYAVIPLILFAHLTPFSLATVRLLNYSNARQEGLMRVAENLTDPTRDFVLDETDMVATRTPLNLQTASLANSLIFHPTPVFIRTLQSEAFGEVERDFLKANYLPLADDFWVLGKALPKGGGAFELLHPGRYRISSLEGSDLAGTYPEGFKALITPEVDGRIDGTVDGSPVTAKVVKLSAGRHHLKCPASCQPVVLWVGPKLDRIHRLGPGDHRDLFGQ